MDKLQQSVNESEDGGMYWVLDIYAGDGELFAVVANLGKLYRVDLTVTGTDVTAWARWWKSKPHSRRCSRGAPSRCDGRYGAYRWTMIAATSVLNRVGEIDSGELFDSFIRHAEETGEYPTLDFYHLGSAGAQWEFGEADYLARDGVCYIASGLFDTDKPLGRAAVNAILTSGDWRHRSSFGPSGNQS